MPLVWLRFLAAFAYPEAGRGAAAGPAAGAAVGPFFVGAAGGGGGPELGCCGNSWLGSALATVGFC